MKAKENNKKIKTFSEIQKIPGKITPKKKTRSKPGLLK